ncbi:hypothetical protein D3C87_1291370 [compost metagenome]
MAQIIHQLKHWQENGLLSEDQLQAILAFEKNKPKNSWALMGFLTLGIAIVVLGIIAIIASNWMEIPDWAKLGTGFAVLIGSAIGIFKLRTNPSLLVTDGLKGFFALSCLAMIGLIAQIYHLKGDGYSTGLLWTAMTLLIISEAKNIFIPLFWNMIFATSVLAGLIINSYAKAYIVEPCSLFVFLLTAVFILLHAFKKDSLITKTMGHTAILTWIIALSFSSVDWYRDGHFGGALFELLNFLPHYLISLFIAIALWNEPSLKKLEKKFFLLGLVMANLLFSLNFMADGGYFLLVAISIVCLLAFAFFFLSREQPRLFNIMLVIIAIKFFEVYVRKFGGLLNTGVGLICTGLVILGIVAGWMKNRQHIEGRLKEWLL